jgi:hypothetical protein
MKHEPIVPSLRVQPSEFGGEQTTFEARKNGTLLHQNTVFQSVEDRDHYVESGMEVGVHESMERLTELVARLTQEV